MVTVGEVIKGKYRVERVLGEGGMGVVVAAQHVALDQKVAIKFLRAEMLASAEVVERFAREARAASRIKSDHVARVLDVDVLDDGSPFMVMEYLEGIDLATGHALPAHVAARHIAEACDAIGEAHRLGIVHRDIKPANLFVAELGGGKTRLKVLDFGISKMDMPGNEPRSTRVTRTTSVMGTAEYMSPEQMRSTRDVDGRTDIWALGATLYELLTAELPFPGENFTQVCAMIMSHTPPPPSTRRAGIPPELDSVVLRCLARDREQRYRSADDLAAALAPFAAGRVAGSGPQSSMIVARSIAGSVTIDALHPHNAGSGTLQSEVPVGLPADAISAPTIAVVTAPTRAAPNAIGAVSSGRETGARSSGLPLILGAITVGAITVVTLLVAVRGSFSKSIDAPSVATATPPGADVVGGGATPAREGPSVAPASAAPAAPTDAPSESPSAAERSEPSSVHARAAGAKTGSPPGTKSTPAGTSAKAPAGKGNCNPPFTVDANGIKHVKRECF